MADTAWRGDAKAVAEIRTITPANPTVGDVFTITMNSKTIVAYTVVAADLVAGVGSEASAVDSVCTAIAAAWNASVVPEAAEVTASNASDGKVTLTGDVAGVPFAVTSTSTGDGSAGDEVQSLSLSGASSGNITLSYAGETTASIAYNASAATIITALELLSTVGAGDIVGSGGALNTSAVVLTFSGATQDDLNVAEIIAADVDLDAGTPAVTTTTQGTAGADTFTDALVTAATGPNHWDDADNWTEGTIPGAADVVEISNSSVDILYGLDQSAVTIGSMWIHQSYTGKIGLPRTNALLYSEYRGNYLQVICPNIEIGQGAGGGSGRIKLDNGSAQTALEVLNTGEPVESGVEAVLWKCTHVSSTVNVNKGSVGIAIFSGEAATVSVLQVGYVENQSSDSAVRCGDGATLTTINQSGGVLVTQSAITTHTMTGGELKHLTSTITTLNIDAGSVRYQSAGTLTTANIGSNGELDFRRDMRTRTVTNTNMHEKSKYYDPFGTVTNTNGFDFVRCTPADCVWDIKPNQTWTASAI